MKVSAVVPIYNENIQVLNSVLLKLQNFVDEIILVDDGSTLTAGQISKQLNIIYLKHQINRGQGAALQTGTNYAVQHGAGIIVHFDGDGQHQPEDIPDLIKPLLSQQADFVFGSRFLGKDNNLPWSKRHILLPIAMAINYLLTGLKLTDVHNGLRAFRAHLAGQLYLSQDRMAHASEYPYLVKKHHIKFTEVPVKIIYHHYGQGIGGGFKILKELLTEKIIK